MLQLPDLQDDARARARRGVTEEAPVCPECSTPMVLKRSRFGQFWACSRYPECKGTRKMVTGKTSPNTPSGVTLPECGEGEIVEKRSRRGAQLLGVQPLPEVHVHAPGQAGAAPLPRRATRRS